MYANIIIDIAHEKVDRTFQYLVPPQLEQVIAVGSQVRAPFGSGNANRTGYVLELTDQAEIAPEKIKMLSGIVENSVSVEQHFLALADWMHHQYGSTMIQCLKTVLPVRRHTRTKERRRVRLLLEADDVERQLALYEKKRARARKRLIEALAAQPGMTLDYEAVTGQLRISASALRAMADEQVIAVESERAYRNPVSGDVNLSARFSQSFCLTGEQLKIVSAVLEEFDCKRPGVSLLHGITGSGKTAVYIELAEQMVNRGRQVIVLIPEIALTYQTVTRFCARFGDRVSILNSRMSEGERYDQFERAKSGQLDVMIGPRSALFTPFLKLGLIVIDEEHEATYKSETMPRYHARETAIERARMLGACVLLGSATPSVESYWKAMRGEYRLFRLNMRHGKASLPSVEVVDLRKELMMGNRSMFSASLRDAIEERLQKKEQMMLFLNRRGYAGILSCRQCGAVIGCPHCAVALSLHSDGRLHCHYCGYSTGGVKRCPTCGSPYIGTFKAGTQKIEEQVRREFANARVLRMDFDATRKKDSYQKILESFADGEADILVGTQMIVKGHDFPNVTLVGVLAADLSLAVSDYRAAERTFQLLEQAAGRAGRSDKAGQVIIQTYQPEHYAVTHAAAHDYEGFYEEEMNYRSLMGYPPAQHMLVIHAAAKEEYQAEQCMKWFARLIREQFPGLVGLGPAPESVAKVSDRYLWAFYLKDADQELLIRARSVLERALSSNSDYEGVSVQFDPDPM